MNGIVYSRPTNKKDDDTAVTTSLKSTYLAIVLLNLTSLRYKLYLPDVYLREREISPLRTEFEHGRRIDINRCETLRQSHTLCLL